MKIVLFRNHLLGLLAVGLLVSGNAAGARRGGPRATPVAPPSTVSTATMPESTPAAPSVGTCYSPGSGQTCWFPAGTGTCVSGCSQGTADSTAGMSACPDDRYGGNAAAQFCNPTPTPTPPTVTPPVQPPTVTPSTFPQPPMNPEPPVVLPDPSGNPEPPVNPQPPVVPQPSPPTDPCGGCPAGQSCLSNSGSVSSNNNACGGAGGTPPLPGECSCQTPRNTSWPWSMF